MEPVRERTTKQDQELAQSSIAQIHMAAKKVKSSGYAEIKMKEQREFLHIPKKAFHLLVIILDTMAEGKSITLIPSESELSTQEAADMLNVSRPFIVKLVDEGQIPHRKAGTHRRIALKDLLDYDEQLKAKRKKNLDFLARQAQELNLGY